MGPRGIAAPDCWEVIGIPMRLLGVCYLPRKVNVDLNFIAQVR